MDKLVVVVDKLVLVVSYDGEVRLFVMVVVIV